MLRRFNTNIVTAASHRTVVATASSSAAASISERRAGICDCLAAIGSCPLVGHFGSLGAISASNLVFTPIGTVALCALAYNVNYVGLKHLWYTSEFPMRDYLQDAALKQALRYLMLIALLLGGSGLFVEI